MPTGEIVADPAYRGDFTGNRGILHGADQRLGTARWRHKTRSCLAWRLCGRRSKRMKPGRSTALIFRGAWTRAFGSGPRAAERGAALHDPVPP